MRINRVSMNIAATIVASLNLCAGRGFGETMIANVPFQFQVQDRQLPAGKYFVTDASNSSAPVILLRNLSTNHGIFILPQAAIAPGANRTPRMVFQCGEETCILSEIWGATAYNGAAIMPPRHPKETDHPTLVYLTRPKNGR